MVELQGGVHPRKSWRKVGSLGGLVPQVQEMNRRWMITSHARCRILAIRDSSAICVKSAATFFFLLSNRGNIFR